MIINEVAWMGTTNSANDEWIEFKNISGSEIDITNWQLIDQGEQIKINLVSFSENNIMPGGFVLFERTDDDTIPSIKADLIYSGGLSNLDEGLRLFDGRCNLIDEVLANSDWPAGDNASKKTMERDTVGLGWHTSDVINGTPKQENSTPSTIYSGPNITTNNSDINNLDENSVPLPHFYPVIINEIMYDFEGSDSGKEWIEIFNSGDTSVDLTNWKFYENQSNHNLTIIQGSINLFAGGYAVIVNDPEKFLVDYPNYNGIIIKSSFSLSNTGETISIKNGDLVIDEINYLSNWGAQGDGNSLQKINNNWEASLPTPGQANQISFSTFESTAVQDFKIQYSSSTKELIFAWQPAEDYSGATSTVIYKITDISQASSTLLTIETASTTAKISINERGRSYTFSIQAFDKEGLGSEKSEAQIDIPPIKQIILAQQLDDTTETDADVRGDPFVQRLSLNPSEFQGTFNRIEFKVFSEDGGNYMHSLWIKEIDPNDFTSVLLFYTNYANLGPRNQWNTIVYDVGNITTKSDKIYEFAIRGRYDGIGGPGAQSYLKVKGSPNLDSYPYGSVSHAYAKQGNVTDLYFRIYLEE